MSTISLVTTSALDPLRDGLIDRLGYLGARLEDATTRGDRDHAITDVKGALGEIERCRRLLERIGWRAQSPLRTVALELDGDGALILDVLHERVELAQDAAADGGDDAPLKAARSLLEQVEAAARRAGPEPPQGADSTPATA